MLIVSIFILNIKQGIENYLAPINKYLQFYIIHCSDHSTSVTAEHLVRASLEPTDDLSIDPPLLSHHIHKPLKVTLRIVRTIYIIPNPISLLLSNEIFHTLYISYLASSHILQSTMHNSGVLVADVGQFNVNTGTHSNQLEVKLDATFFGKTGLSMTFDSMIVMTFIVLDTLRKSRLRYHSGRLYSCIYSIVASMYKRASSIRTPGVNACYSRDCDANSLRAIRL